MLLLTLDNPSYGSTDNRFTYDATVLSGDALSAESMHTATLLIDSTGAVDYKKAAEREYRKLLDAWVYDGGDDKDKKDKYENKMMWYQGNAMDTLIDYVAITKEAKKGSDLGKKIKTVWKTARPYGWWWDDFGWWGVAFLNAAKNYKILGQQSDTEYMNNAEDCLQNHMDTATTVWKIATTEPACIPCLQTGPANWYRFEPRFSGGVWNSAFAGLNSGKQAGGKPQLSVVRTGRFGKQMESRPCPQQCIKGMEKDEYQYAVTDNCQLIHVKSCPA